MSLPLSLCPILLRAESTAIPSSPQGTPQHSGAQPAAMQPLRGRTETSHSEHAGKPPFPKLTVGL